VLNFKEYKEKTMTYKDAVKFIKKAHAGQKYGSKPYWTHPVAVAEVGVKVFGSKFNETCRIVSALHDVIEDTDHDRESLSALGFSDEVLDAVELLTKDGSMNCAANIARLIDSGN